jgi:DNA topoisomerase-2
MKDMIKILSKKNSENAVEEVADQEEDEGAANAAEFNYLLSMPLWSLTYEKVESLKAEYLKKSQELQVLIGTSIEEMYSKDLDDFIQAYSELEEGDKKEQKTLKSQATQNISKTKTSKSKPKKKKTKDLDSEDEDGDFDDGDDEDDFAPEKKKKELKKKETKEKAKEEPEKKNKTEK